MKKKTMVKLAIFLLIIFFEMQFLSHIFFEIGQGKEDQSKLKLFKTSSILFPIDSTPIFEYGYTLIEKYKSPPDNDMIARSISYFKKALKYNILHYYARFYLAKAYLHYNYPQSEYFNQAIREAKRAATLRWKNPHVSRETLKLLISLWPLLNKEDKDFCLELLQKSIKRMNRDDFKAILDIWSLYSKDLKLFENVLKQMPQFYFILAEKLKNIEKNLQNRQSLLSANEIYKLAQLKYRYQNYLADRSINLRLLKSLEHSLRTHIIGYYKLTKNNRFNEKEYFDFIRHLHLNNLEIFFQEKNWQNDSQVKQELESLIINTIDEFSKRDDQEFAYKSELKILENFLIENKFFDTNDLKIFYIKQLINFKSQQFDSLTGEIEQFKKSISFVKKEHLQDYANTLLLLSATYIKSRLLLKASNIIYELEQQDIEPLELYWQKKQIEHVVGPEKVIAEKTKLRYQQISHSHIIELSSRNLKWKMLLKRKIYLENNNIIQIKISDELREKLLISSFPGFLEWFDLSGVLFKQNKFSSPGYHSHHRKFYLS